MRLLFRNGSGRGEENKQRKSEHLLKVSQIREMYRKDQMIPHAEARCCAADMQKEGRHNLVLWHEGIAGRRAEDVASAFITF
nr:unnamed protein product [Callosobruchus chinensis]